MRCRLLATLALITALPAAALQTAATATPAQGRRRSAEPARDLFNRAAALIEKDQPEAAIPLLRRAARLAPNEAAIHHYLGYALWRGAEWESAAVEFERALQLDPHNAYTKYFLARIALSRQQADRAIELLQAVIASGDAPLDTHRQLGQAYLAKGDLRNAAELMQQAVQQAPLDGALHYQLAKVYQALNRSTEAAEEFAASRRLRQADQASIQTLFALATAIRGNQPAEARKLSQQLLQDASRDPEILIRLGIVLGQGGFYQEAVRPLELAAEQVPSSFEAHCNLGLTLVRLGRHEEAQAPLERALELRPDSFEANATLAFLYVTQGRNAEAVLRLRAANAARANNPKILALLGQQYLQGRYLDEAIETLRTVVRLRPGDASSRYLLIDAYQKDGQYEKALESAREARQLFPGDARAYLETGRQLEHLGRHGEARPYLERAVRMDPSSAEAYCSLGVSLLRSGEYGAALDSFAKAKSLDAGDARAALGRAQSLILLNRLREALGELEESIQAHPDDALLQLELSRVCARLGDQHRAARAAARFEQLNSERAAKEAKRRFASGAAAPK